MPQSGTMRVGDVIDKRPMLRLQPATVGFCVRAAVLDGFDTQKNSVLAPWISKMLEFPFAQSGSVFATGLVGYV